VDDKPLILEMNMDLRALLTEHSPTVAATIASLVAIQVLLGGKSIADAIKTLLPFPGKPKNPELTPEAVTPAVSLPGGFIFDDPLDVVRYLARLVLQKVLPSTPQWQEVIDLIEKLLEKLAQHETASAKEEVDGPGASASAFSRPLKLSCPKSAGSTKTPPQ
jgi:hypothetical protein